MTSRIIILLLMISLCAIGCTREDQAVRVLTKQGFKQIHITGYEWLECGKDDLYHTGFTAISPSGSEVSGVVCSGVFKGATIRFNE